MDELLLLGGKRRQEEDGAASVGERAREAVRRQLASREERARELERQAEEVKGRLSEVTLALEMAQQNMNNQLHDNQAMANKIRKLNAENEQLKKERTREGIEESERREKEVGEVMAELRNLKAINSRMQMDNDNLNLHLQHLIQ